PFLPCRSLTSSLSGRSVSSLLSRPAGWRSTPPADRSCSLHQKYSRAWQSATCSDSISPLKVAPNKLNGRALFVKRKETVEVCRGLRAHFFRVDSAQLAQLPCYFLHERGLIALPAVRHRGQVWGVGLDKDAVERNFKCRIANLLGFRESHVPGERN